MKFDRHQSPGHQINYLARLFAQALYRRIGRHGVTRGQFPVLLTLWEAEGVTQAELAERLAVEQPTMANTLKRMERDGLIRRTADPDDRRRALIHLTPRGRELEEVLTASARETNAAALADVSPEETEQMMAIVRRMIQNLQRDAQAHQPGGEP